MRRSHWLLALLLALAAALAACGGSGPANGEQPSEEGALAVVSAHGAATDAGIEVLLAGGSAADAAVAVAAALSVVEPWFSSVLGGGTWALYYDASAEVVTSLDGVGPVGSNASVADYAARASQSGMHQANVPGAWDGWMLWLERYGRLSLAEVLAPAVGLAREGVPVSAEMAAWLNRGRQWILANEHTAAIYAPGGELLQRGATVYQHDLADTLETLAAAFDAASHDGRTAALQAARDHYYRGPLADALVSFSDDNGGYLTLADFHGFEAQIVDPVSIEYREGVRVYQNPPNSQGITMLLALNVLEGFDLASLGPDHPDAIHLQVEALKLAFADRHYHVGDPERVHVPVEELLSDEHAERQRQRIALDEVLTWPIQDVLDTASREPLGTHSAGSGSTLVQDHDEATGTTTFHVLDAEGNAAAVTTSLGAQFYVVGDTGIHINNRMRFIALADGDPNQLTPGYKVRHTSNPYMVLRDGRPYLLGGNTGADTQAQAQVQQVVNVIDHGLTPGTAVARPRFVTSAFPATTYPYRVGNTLSMESGFPAALVDELRQRGHEVSVGPGVWGVAHLLMVDEPGSAVVAREPRSSTSAGVVITKGE